MPLYQILAGQQEFEIELMDDAHAIERTQEVARKTASGVEVRCYLLDDGRRKVVWVVLPTSKI